MNDIILYAVDMIMTQMFFDVDVFKTFVNDCRTWGINCPIIPGLMCINAYAGFKRMTKFCKTRVPQHLEDKMESIKDDAVAVKAFGVEFGHQVCQSLLAFGVNILHFYTLNLEKVVYGITDKLGITHNLFESTDDVDATTMVAVGSAWARVGDRVKSFLGEGILKDIRSDGVGIVESTSWILAYGQRPVAFLQKGQYQKAFS